jgi:hypothetical protein
MKNEKNAKSATDGSTTDGSTTDGSLFRFRYFMVFNHFIITISQSK